MGILSSEAIKRRKHTKYGFSRGPDIPCPYPGVDANAADDITLSRMPIDISYCAIVSFENVLDGCLST
jgi:hypothetical protein